jgi:hypothetical protein
MATAVALEYTYEISGEADSGYRYLRQAIYPRSFGADPDERLPLLHNLPDSRNSRLSANSDGTELTPSLMVQEYASTGIERSSTLILVPVSSVEHETERFSDVSYRRAFGRVTHGPEVIPFRLNIPEGQSTTATALSSSVNQVYPPAAHAFDAVLVRDYQVSL